ncbi:MAG: hypothetical protein OER95_08505 [Acidimicrobiia bacterium]|nr:hypothetical protein [Acidimicrobiia bacterium]
MVETVLARAADLDRRTGTATHPMLWCASAGSGGHEPPDGWILVDSGTSGWLSELQLESLTGLHVIDADLNLVGVDGATMLHTLWTLWRAVIPGGFLSISFNYPEATIDFDDLIDGVLEATSGRILTEELVVHDHQPASVGRWATVVWTRLGPPLSRPGPGG